MAERSGWTQVRTLTRFTLKVLAKAVADLNFAVNEAADELMCLALPAQGGVGGAPGG